MTHDRHVWQAAVAACQVELAKRYYTREDITKWLTPLYDAPLPEWAQDDEPLRVPNVVHLAVSLAAATALGGIIGALLVYEGVF